jgi:prephenate dehydratase
MAKYNINLTSINSKPPKQFSGRRKMNVDIAFNGSFEDDNVVKCAEEIR